MTDEIFTASNGITVTIDSRGYLIAKGGRDDMTTYATAGAFLGVQALREYFQHERDQQLGRWRDPENPDYVVYPADDGLDKCWVINEKEPTDCEPWAREQIARGVFPTLFGYDSAKRYFDAHPGAKPWYEAHPGEVWLVTAWGNEPEPMFVRGGNFIEAATWEIPVTSPLITHAEKIYPKDEQGE